jgi:hypothetical protein
MLGDLDACTGVRAPSSLAGGPTVEFLDDIPALELATEPATDPAILGALDSCAGVWAPSVAGGIIAEFLRDDPILDPDTVLDTLGDLDTCAGV